MFSPLSRPRDQAASDKKGWRKQLEYASEISKKIFQIQFLNFISQSNDAKCQRYGKIRWKYVAALTFSSSRWHQERQQFSTTVLLYCCITNITGLN